MAINDIFKSVTAGGVNSLDYGVYITGEAVYNAPERRVEFISIPGRNGDLILDGGVFENIEVKYPAGTFGDDQSDFSEKIQAYRNALKAQRGYQRITDDYHPDEFRLGVLVDAIEIDAVQQSKGGEFDIVFNCKPQRFLTSGETAVAVTDGDTITNPTLFDASPLLLIEGYGGFSVNGHSIQIENDPIGNIIAVEPWTGVIGRSSYVADFSTVYIMADDTISLSNMVGDSTGVNYSMLFTVANTAYTLVSAEITDIHNDDGRDHHGTPVALTGVNITATIQNEIEILVQVAVSSAASFSYTKQKSLGGHFALRLGLQINGGQTVYDSAYLNYRITYNGAKNIEFYITTPYSTWESWGIYPSEATVSTKGIKINSTAPKFGHPTYIDCDIGEAYGINDGVISSLNRYIALGSNLPTLNPGENEITADETITGLSIIPRWWII